MPSAARDPESDPRTFDHLPAVFDRFAELNGAPLIDYVGARLPLHGRRAVDLGAGTGLHSQLLAMAFTDVLAVDISAPMLAYARARRPAPNIRYEQRDLREVTLDSDGAFDLVFSAYALHHIEDLDQTLRQLCTPGGQVIVVDSVDPRRRVPRGWLRSQARRALAADLLHRRRPRSEALEAYRLATHPAWMDHVSTDLFLAPEEFTQQYTAVFPGAEITPLYRSRALHWRAPSEPPAGLQPESAEGW